MAKTDDILQNVQGLDSYKLRTELATDIFNSIAGEDKILNLEEYKAFLQRENGNNLTDDQLNAAVAKLKTDLGLSESEDSSISITLDSFANRQENQQAQTAFEEAVKSADISNIKKFDSLSIPEARKIFSEADTSGDGSISRSEFFAYLDKNNNNLSEAQKEKAWQELLGSSDSNKDSSISSAEFTSKSANKISTFDQIDKNNDGVLSESELKNASYLQYKNMDLNGDKKLSYGEMIFGLNDNQNITRESSVLDDIRKSTGEDGVNKLFDKYDKNGDGTITSEEIQTVDNQEKSKMNAGVIALIIIGSLLLVGIIAILVHKALGDEKKEKLQNRVERVKQQGDNELAML